MTYLRSYNWKAALTRVAIVSSTLFLSAAMKDYVLAQNATQAVMAGVKTLPEAVILGLGLDQLLHNFMQQKDVKDFVGAAKILSEKKEN